MKLTSDIWKYDYGLYKVYVDRKAVLNKLTKLTQSEVNNKYYTRGKESGWDLQFETKYLSDVKKIIREYKKK